LIRGSRAFSPEPTPETSLIAQRLSTRGSEVAGYDLLNEPAIPPGARKNSPADWNGLARRMIAAIRAKDSTHPGSRT